MCNRIILFMVFCFLLAFSQLDYAGTSKPLSVTQQQFIHTLVPIIHATNADIAKARARLEKCYRQFHWRNGISWVDCRWLNHLAAAYGITPDFSEEKTWKTLLSRVDSLPTSLVLAQAINESAWGQSRFAKEGNNYFGQWCYTKGCGIVPAKRAAGRTYEVKRFDSPSDSIKSYYRNLNTNATYKPLRELRAQQREKQGKLNSLELAEGLIGYSQRKAAYVKSIQALIQHFDLNQYDMD